MRRLLLPVVAAVLSAGVFVHAADDLVLARFGDYLEALRAQAGIPGLAAVIVGPTDIQWERAFGFQNVERSGATRTDTLFHTDSLTQIATSTLVLQCVEEGRLALEDPIGQYAPSAPEPRATIYQLLTHTSPAAEGLAFSYRPERLDPLGAAIAACTGDTFVHAVALFLERNVNMFESIPGVDVVHTTDKERFSDATIARYTDLLTRLATPYSVDKKGRPSVSVSPAKTLTPASGLVSTVRDLAKFDLAFKRGDLLQDDTIVAAWSAPTTRTGQRLPHGLGWFVQSYRGEPVVWQFGVAENASSSMIILLPRRSTTLILLANSDGLVKPFALSAGDVTVSPFAKLFLGVFVR